MRAVRLHGVGDLRVERVPTPKPGPDEVLLRPLAVGVCGTDTHLIDGRHPAATPVILGHEVAGEVVAVGTRDGGTARPAENGASAVAPGALVTVQPNLYCHRCAYCRRGLRNMCLAIRAYGVHLDGGAAEAMVVPARLVFPLPPGTPVEIGAFAEPLACCLHGMDRLAPRPGLPILVNGCGPAGAMLVALARLAGGCPVVATDPRPYRRELALRCGADAVLDPAADDLPDRALDLTGGLGFPYLIDAVGSAAVLETCVALAARGGTVLVFGVASPAAVARISPNQVYARELTVLGTALNPDTQLRAVAMLGRLPLTQLRIATYPLERAADAIAAARAGVADKVQLAPAADIPADAPAAAAAP